MPTGKYRSVYISATFTILCCTLGIPDENLSFEKKLHKRLFNESYYSVDLLPVENLSSTINVSFGFDLTKIVQVVSASFIFFMSSSFFVKTS